MELRHLRYFAAVADELNFRAAAERLHLSAPALSKQIKDLEAEIGVRLLDRDTTGVQLTNAGAVFLEETKALLERAERAVEMAKEAAKGRRGRLVVANIGSLTANDLGACLAAFSEKYPGVDVELVDLDIGRQISALEQGNVHVGFIPLQILPLFPPGFRHVSVLTTPLRAAVGRSHRLARQTKISLAELARERVLVAGGGKPSLHGSFVAALLARRGLKAARMVEVQGFESLLAMIGGGQGVSILTGRGGILRAEDVVVRPLKESGSDLMVELHAIWREGDADLLARNFIAVFREFARGERPTRSA